LKWINYNEQKCCPWAFLQFVQDFERQTKYSEWTQILLHKLKNLGMSWVKRLQIIDLGIICATFDS
jgi:hypothetical protein